MFCNMITHVNPLIHMVTELSKLNLFPDINNSNILITGIIL